ncbi:hypothetical protein AAMO2058_001582300 [Amorphochlora amoebiformis]
MASPISSIALCVWLRSIGVIDLKPFEALHGCDNINAEDIEELSGGSNAKFEELGITAGDRERVREAVRSMAHKVSLVPEECKMVEKTILSLKSMGFSRDVSIEAIAACGPSTENCVGYILAGKAVPPEVKTREEKEDKREKKKVSFMEEEKAGEEGRIIEMNAVSGHRGSRDDGRGDCKTLEAKLELIRKKGVKYLKKYQPQTILIEVDELTFGRPVEASKKPGHVFIDTRIPQMISRKHARITREEGRFFITSFGKNGVKVNGYKVRTAELKPNDVVTFGTKRSELVYKFTCKVHAAKTEIKTPRVASPVSPGVSAECPKSNGKSGCKRSVEGTGDASKSPGDSRSKRRRVAGGAKSSLSGGRGGKEENKNGREEFKPVCRQRQASTLDLTQAVMVVSGCCKEKAVIALQAAEGNVSRALDFLEREKDVVDLAIEAKATVREARVALQYCNGDKIQACRFLASDPLELGALNQLKDHQRLALSRVASESQKLSIPAVARLEKRWVRENLDSLCTLERVLEFIRDKAQIIIHVDLPQTLRFLLKDTHYRNLFETGSSGGLQSLRERTKWEKRLFEGLYDGSSAFDRVKYGVCNIVQDIEGIRSCHGYGKSYMVLKEVRLRTTFSDQDTSARNCVLATCQHYAHVLETYDTQELRAVAEVASGRKPWGCPSTMIHRYKEVQIHGPVRLDRHVECLCVHPDDLDSDPGLSDVLERFSKKHRINVIEIEIDPESLSDRPGHFFW